MAPMYGTAQTYSMRMVVPIMLRLYTAIHSRTGNAWAEYQRLPTIRTSQRTPALATGGLPADAPHASPAQRGRSGGLRSAPAHACPATYAAVICAPHRRASSSCFAEDAYIHSNTGREDGCYGGYRYPNTVLDPGSARGLAGPTLSSTPSSLHG